MATRRVADVESALLAKGMERDDSHHHMYRKTLGGITTLVTRMSHGKKEIGNDLLGRMAKQCCLRQGEFLELVDCPMSEAEWDRLVGERCAHGRNPFIGR